MKNQPTITLPNVNRWHLTHGISKLALTAAHAVLIGIGATVSTGQEVDSETDDQGAQVLTRGPVHEAFAGIVSYNPEPGVMVDMAPPELIEELPPEIRPAGDNISWIPGYWAWDDERTDYLWVSGTWRALPPGRQWTTGYWAGTGQDYQWISGYWADATVQEITYLPKPPVTVEAGPNVAAPSRDHSWTPGSWMWQQERYAWRPGYWAEGRSNWDWIPANYVSTPRGYVFVDGYWDYSFDRRGVLYAPVYFQSGYRSRPNYSYSPVIAIGLAAVVEHLFLRPRNHHYYFGDYYDRRYRDNGYYSPHAYQSSRYGYDPVYSYRRWTHRQDRDWERRYEASYIYRRDHESARPPHTWADQRRLRMDTAEAREQQLLMATPFEQMANRRDNPIRIERVAAQERERITVMNREVRETRERRRTLETEGVNIRRDQTEREFKPTKARLPASPIVGRSADNFDADQAPPRPQRTSVADPESARSDRQPDAERTRPDRRTETEPGDRKTNRERSTPGRGADPDSVKQPTQTERRGDKSTREEPQVRDPSRETRKDPDGKKPTRESRQEPEARDPNRETRQGPQTREPNRETRQEPQAREPNRETRKEPQANEPKRETRKEPQAREPKRETRQEPQAREPKRETRKEPQAREPKRETRPEPQVREPKREPRKEPQVREPKRETRQPQESTKPPVRKKSEKDEE